MSLHQCPVAALRHSVQWRVPPHGTRRRVQYQSCLQAADCEDVRIPSKLESVGEWHIDRDHPIAIRVVRARASPGREGLGCLDRGHTAQIGDVETIPGGSVCRPAKDVSLPDEYPLDAQVVEPDLAENHFQPEAAAGGPDGVPIWRCKPPHRGLDGTRHVTHRRGHG